MLLLRPLLMAAAAGVAAPCLPPSPQRLHELLRKEQ